MAPVTPVTGCEAVRREVGRYHKWNVRIITAIAEAESHCRVSTRGDGHLTFKKNGRTYGYSLSAMQVRILPGRERCDSHDLKVNVKCAYQIWQGQGYKAWTMFNNGKYKQYLK